MLKIDVVAAAVWIMFSFLQFTGLRGVVGNIILLAKNDSSSFIAVSFHFHCVSLNASESSQSEVFLGQLIRGEGLVFTRPSPRINTWPVGAVA
jgi:hypothetical protein